MLDRKPYLNQEGAAEIVLNSLFWLEKQGIILLDAAVVMPDHLHFVAGLKNGSLAELMRRMKRYTARQVNILFAREGPFWQPQYHDHAIRKEEDLNGVVLYTLHNPVRADLVKDFHDYPYWYCRWDV